MPVATTAKVVKQSIQLTEAVGLIVIAIATVIAGYQEVMVMINHGKVTLADLLLMFIYLEVLAMVGLFYSRGALPVQVPIFIAIVALARYLILDTKELHEWRVISIATAICLLAISALLVRRGEASDREDAARDSARHEAKK
jgi:protein PsiE